MNRKSAVGEEQRARWNWPIDINSYDRSPQLTADEQDGVNVLLSLRWHGQYSRPPWSVRLQRLLDPIMDSLRWMAVSKNDRAAILKLLLREMQRTQCSFWKWTPTEWINNLIEPTSPHSLAVMNGRLTHVHRYLIAVPILLRRLTDLRGIVNFNRVALASKVFGISVEPALRRVSDVLMRWGYASRLVENRERICLCEALIRNSSPHIEDLSLEVLKDLHATSTTRARRYAFQRISKALCSMGILKEPIQHSFDRPRGGALLDVMAGVSEEWLSFVTRWRDTSTSSVNGRSGTYYLLLKAGRWVTHEHPELASPERWTRETAAAYVAAACRMKVGDWTIHVNRPSDRGKPLTPAAMAGSLNAVRVFFRDCQEWEWIPRRFDPQRCLRVPSSVRARMGPNPRIIADDVWAKLVWAGVNLEAADFHRQPTGHAFFPIEMVRAVAAIWLFAGLRCDEIRRLRIGSIRNHSLENADTRACILHVPVNKTSTAFTKPVDPIIGRAVAAWEAVRPVQPALLDRKTGEFVHFLFAYRARQLSERYLNRVLIQLLCSKAGVPRTDVRGAITSHRGRATIASQLYNAKQPLSLFELQEWMGHRSPQATQFYAKISATKLAKSYDQAGYFERNLRTIDVLIDQDAIRGGLKEDEPWKFYDLGHGYCTYDFFDQCPHRMACAKCSFYRAKTSSKADLLEAKANLLRLRCETPLLDVEIAAIDDGIAAFDSLLGKLADVPTPAGPTPRELGTQVLVKIDAKG